MISFSLPRSSLSLVRSTKAVDFRFSSLQSPLSFSRLARTPRNKRSFSSKTSSSSILDHAVVHSRGDMPYGSREYLLLPREASLQDLEHRPTLLLASIWAHRNTLFGAQLGPGGATDPTGLLRLGEPLVASALDDAGSQGEQPQAVSTLHGLCQWVQDTVEDNPVVDKLRKDDPVGWEAAWAIATQEPRPAHSVVGQGTYRDGSAAWEALAKAFVVSAQGGSVECQLYLAAGAELVGIELLAGTKPEYLRSAGGAMARLFFL